ncbi:DUF397 domain-containing protein [Goodfellowiella coeruleoviolacea]|uniref:DUF397 domain-containing protein n=1 Tax=Goodfellowiella coeruleoviolacea TaxID=334858 RepID=A0AAE3GBA5_9PSEU|nr:DUF397 domain-containing protein [Goodfellowiella coeruleoviolacea]MCP2164235.1 protein of unknown function (DUF397) [Goodfellowiella coeruleoviolacea]
MTTPVSTWRKSSRSNSNKKYDCVEVALGANWAGLRDSKHPEAGNIQVNTGAWTQFLTAAKSGRFDLG